MPIRTIATLAVAIMLGVFAVVLVRNYLGNNRAAQTAAAPSSTVPIVVASAPIARGAVLQPNLLKITRVPADAAPAGSFQTIEQLAGPPPAPGQPSLQRVALTSIAPNEAILPTKVTGPGGRAILSTTLAQGMRAVSLRSNEIAGVAGFVLPGDHVDILLTRTVESNTVTQTLADNILVLAVDQNPSDESSAPQLARAVTIQVTPEQAYTIALGQTVGQVSLALRSINDPGLPMKRAITVANLGFVRAPAPAASRAVTRAPTPNAPPPPPPGDTVRVTRGTEVTGYQVGGVR
jgi:pilus assembly protein CpaB